MWEFKVWKFFILHCEYGRPSHLLCLAISQELYTLSSNNIKDFLFLKKSDIFIHKMNSVFGSEISSYNQQKNACIRATLTNIKIYFIIFKKI